MVDINSIERALLVNVVKNKNWNIVILNDLTEDNFTFANREMYNYIKKYIVSGSYPDLQALSYTFEITDDLMAQYLQVEDLQSLCDTIKTEYLREELKYEVGQLNTKSQMIQTNPAEYINLMGGVYESLKNLSFKNRTVGLFDEIENILTIDPNDVISTGFRELDQKLIGWKRGEELVVFMARTGQGKSWMGLKFAFSASVHGEKVGIYSGEMSVQQLQERILCCAKQNYTDTKEDAIKYIKEKNLDIRILTQKELRRKANVNDIEEMIVRDKLTMVVIDQLSLMEDISAKPGTPLRQQYGNISMDLFTLSQKHNVPIILLVQSNRQGSNEVNGPTLENIAESDAVAQNSTRVISMRNDAGILTLNIIKNRYGESGLTQKYETDYGINKYRPIRDLPMQNDILKKAKAKSIFGNSPF